MRWLLILASTTLNAVIAQTTQGSLRGVVEDSVDGHVLSGVTIECVQTETGLRRTATTDSRGEFALLALSTGTYRVTLSAPDYQAQVMENLEIRTASRTELPFRLRPAADVFERQQQRNLQALEGQVLLPLIGPDLSAGLDVSLATSPLKQESQLPVVSAVVEKKELYYLPLAARDAYSLLVVLAGVNSDAGSGRGLGLTVSGQRPTSSAFRLDGFQNSNTLTTGPAISLAPEALDEYRVSLAQFSAEYGGTSGYLANAVSRRPTERWHGVAYTYLRNDAFNANSFRRNRAGIARAAGRAIQPGFAVSGPLFGKLGGISVVFETLRSRDEGQPQTVDLPAADYAAFTDPASASRQLLDRFAAPLPNVPQLSGPVLFRPNARLRRVYGGVRTDQRIRADTFRLFERVLVNRLDRPDFLTTPYPDFVTPLRQDNAIASVSGSWTPTAQLFHEFRAGFGYDRLSWNRRYPQIPTLFAFNVLSGNPLLLPGSPAAYSFDNRNDWWQAGYNLTWLHFGHEWKVGAQAGSRRNSGALTFGQDGRYVFGDILDFYIDRPASYDVGVDRLAADQQPAPYRTTFRVNQFALFAQDVWRPLPRLTLSAGVRYESFGAPRLLGNTTLTTVALGDGGSLPERIASAQLTTAGAGTSAFSPDRNNLGVRLGFTYGLGVRGLVLRASYGVFYDSPFDNLWQNLRSNAVTLESIPLGVQTDYLQPGALANAAPGFRSGFPDLLLMQPGLRTPYVQNYFIGLSGTAGDFWQWEANGLGSQGRKLTTSDRVNRPYSLPASTENPLGYINPALGTLTYRANQGSSSFSGLNLVLRHRSTTWLLEASYTWSHAIDNQSDPLAGDYLDLAFTGVQSADPTRGIAAFSRQFDSRADRGNSDFDQRHNLVLLSSWQVPGLPSGALRGWTEGWRISTLATIRSGLPYTVFAPSSSGGAVIYNRRADYLGGPVEQSGAVPGGLQILNQAAFGTPLTDQGNLGRNALRARGFYGLDVSLAKSFTLTAVAESLLMTVRVDAFNVLNHANLDRPSNVVGTAGFGQAMFGRQGQASSFPAAVPLNESPRQLQIGLRMEF